MLPAFTTGTFVMIKTGIWRVHDIKTRLTYPQSEIYIVVGDPEPLIVSTHASEHARPHHDTCTGDGADIAYKFPAREIATVVHVPRPATNTYQDSFMLRTSVPIQELSPHCSNRRSKCMFQKCLYPVWTYHLCVVVQK